jgi:hypothetical protein
MAKVITVVHCPGFEKTEDDCGPLFDVYESLGLRVMPFIPSWEYWQPNVARADTMTELAITMAGIAMCYSAPAKTVLLAGHSLGAIIAANAVSVMEYMAWPPQPDTRLASFSPSPLPDRRVERAYSNPGSDTRRFSANRRHDVGKVRLNPVFSPALTLCGAREVDYLQAMWQDTARIWMQVDPYMPVCGHDLNHPAYLKMIRRQVPSLLGQKRKWPLVNQDAGYKESRDGPYGSSIYLDTVPPMALPWRHGLSLP